MAYDFDDQFGNQYRDEIGPSDQRGRPRRRRRSSIVLILGILFGSGFVVLLCCGGFGGLMVFGFNVIAKEVELQLRDNAALVEHIGEIEEFDIDWMASMAHPEDDVFVFEVTGTKGSGEITAKSVTMPDGNESVEWATLRLPTGETIELIEP